MPRLNDKEGPILKGARDLMDARGFRPFRTNSGVLRNLAGRPVRFGFPGLSDLIGLVPRTLGRLIVVECKRPGGRPTEAQRAFLEIVRDAGGVSLLIDDLTRLDAALVTLLADPTTALGFDGRKPTSLS